MAHFAQINDENIVIWVTTLPNEIITDENGNEIEQLGIDHILNTIPDAKNYTWKQTSYHANFRNLFAGIGYTYNEEYDAFIPPKLFDSWILKEIITSNDKKIYTWNPPIDPPDLTEEQILSKMNYMWNEEAYQSGDYDNAWVLEEET